MPMLGDTESAFCAVRGALMNVLTDQPDGPLWLKKCPPSKKRKKSQKGGTMDELNYVRPTQEQVHDVIRRMASGWAAKAAQWWESYKLKHSTASRWEAAMQPLVLKPRLVLQLESTLCETGNRQLRTRVGLRTKARWRPRAPRKDFSSVTTMYAGMDGRPLVTAGVEIYKGG